MLLLGVPLLNASNTAGVGWSSNLQISHGAWCSGSAYLSLDIAIDGSNVYAAWTDGRDHMNFDYNLYFTYSSDMGNTWKVDKEISTLGYYSSHPVLAVSGDNIHIFLEENDTFYYVYSFDKGVSWKEKSIASVTSGNYGESYDAAVDGGYLYFIWSESHSGHVVGDYDIYLVKSQDSGATWSNPMHVAIVTPASSHASVRLAVLDDRAYIVSDAGFFRSDDRGNSWGVSKGYPVGIDIRVDERYVHVMSGTSYGFEGYMRSGDSGQTWSGVNKTVKGFIATGKNYVYALNGPDYYISLDRGNSFNDSGKIPNIEYAPPYHFATEIDQLGRAHVLYEDFVKNVSHVEIFYVRSLVPPTFPSAPLNLQATPSNAQVTLAWDPPRAMASCQSLITRYIAARRQAMRHT